jgi:polysaccharide chain length determinant protein (PEP-CTERM system associated)
MTESNASSRSVNQRRAAADQGQLPLEHYVRLILHRKWIIIVTFLLVSGATFAITYRLPNIFTSETLILVDPQRVPEAYVKPTVTGDIRNRLGTLSQQILSATRLQKIIDTLNLYPSERKTMAREDVIAKMRLDIGVSVVSDFGASQDLQAFRISYSGREPQLVAQVANQLASLFIEENLKAREQQATGTTEFLASQLAETRKTLEEQEAKLKDFKLQHIGEMPEQQTADLQILGQLQAQLQSENDTLGRAQQQKSYLQSLAASTAPVVDLDDGQVPNAPNANSPAQPASAPKPATPPSPLVAERARLAAMLERGYTDQHPDVQKLKRQIRADEEKESKEAAAAEAAREVAAPPAPPVPPPPARPPVRPAPINTPNPVVMSQLAAVDEEIAKHKQEQQRLTKLVGSYQTKLEAIPLREQQITDLARDYEISKTHYSQLLEKQLSAETATQLEVRQKGEKFSVLDPAQAAERPSKPNRLLLNAAGSASGLALGFIFALATEFLGLSVTGPEQVTEATGLPVFEIIPIIETGTDRRQRKRRLVLTMVSGVVITVAVSVAVLIYRYRV